MELAINNFIVPILLFVGIISVITLFAVEFSRYKKIQKNTINDLTKKNISIPFTITLDEEKIAFLVSFLKSEMYQRSLQRTFDSWGQSKQWEIGEENLFLILRHKDTFSDYPSIPLLNDSIKMTDLDFLQGIGLNANMRGGVMRKVNLASASLKAADLSLVDLSESNLSEINLVSANLSGANLHRTNLSRAKLQQCRLTEANLSNADLSYANLQGADLTNAILKDSKLIGADLNGTNLSKADLSYADLSGADLGTAVLTGTILQEVIYDEGTKWPADYAYHKDT